MAVIPAGNSPDVAAAPHFEMVVEERPDRTVVCVAGDLVYETVDALRDQVAALRDAGTAAVDLDLTRVTFCDSACIRVLYELAARDEDGVRIHGISPQIAYTLQLAGIDGLLPRRHPGR
jgi:anti-anti-sigma factor